MRPLAVLAVAAALVAACTAATQSSTGTTPPAGEPASSSGSSGPAGGGADCNPQSCSCHAAKAGGACVDAGVSSCTDTQWCDGGLIIDDEALTCTAGTWVTSGNACPAPGGVDAHGCPQIQPADGTACTAADGTKCSYGLDCAIGEPCPDASSLPPGQGCAQAHQALHGDSTCTGGKWSTNPVGTCGG